MPFDTPPGSEIRVYREKKKCWEGPFLFSSYNRRKTAFIDITDKIVPFSITCVRPFLQEHETNNQKETKSPLSLGTRIEVFWPLDNKYYRGIIQDYEANTMNTESCAMMAM